MVRLMRHLLDIPDSTSAYPEWGSELRKRDVLARADELLNLLPSLDERQVWGYLDAIERLASEPGAGILNRMARDELVVQLRAIAVAAGGSGAR